MICRIVKLVFKPEHIDRFLQLFDEQKHRIRSFEGCSSLELLKSKADDRIYFTISIWQDERALETYRQSDLFKKTWHETKALFHTKPEAWTAESLISM